MIKILILMLFNLMLIHCDQPYLLDGEPNWDEVSDKICSTESFGADIVQQVNKCNEFDPNFKINVC